MSTTIHLQLDIKGAILNRSFDGFRDTKTGRELSRQEAESNLLDLLASGVRFLPIGDCPDFDPVTGCPGHRDTPTGPTAPEAGSSSPGDAPGSEPSAGHDAGPCAACGAPVCMVEECGVQGHDGCEMSDGRVVCSAACWDALAEVADA